MIRIKAKGLSREVESSLVPAFISAIGEQSGNWLVTVTADAINSAWDVEVTGPNRFHWERRFSGGDRDAEVISEGIRSAVADAGLRAA